MAEPDRAVRPLLGRTARRWWLVTHVVVSVGWLGAGAANVVLAWTAATTADARLRTSGYLLIHRIDAYLVIPCAFAALLTGVVLSVFTKWGLLRHWWVLTKFVLTMAVIVYSTFGVGFWVEEAIADTAAGGRTALAERIVVGALLNIVAFAFMTWASVTKPWPRTPWSPAVSRRTPRRPGVPPTL